MQANFRDAIDRDLIAILEDEARISASELARRLGIARSTVNERIARLEREGVIMGYSAIIRPPSETNSTQSWLFLICDRLRCNHIIAGMKALPEIKYCYSVTGNYDLICMCETPTAEDLDSVIGEIVQIRGVRTVDSTVILSKKFCRGIDQILSRATTLAMEV